RPFSSAGWSQESLESFMLAMHLSTSLESSYLLKELNIQEGYYSVLDVGGGIGTVSSGFEELKQKPGRIAVYDRNTSIELFRKLNLQIAPSGQTNVEYIGGDFFIDSKHGGLNGLE